MFQPCPAAWSTPAFHACRSHLGQKLRFGAVGRSLPVYPYEQNRHFVRSSLICHLVKKALAMLEDYADPATKQAALTTAPQKSELGVRREKAALSSGCKAHRQPLQPEAIGAVMEATKWLKPSISVSRIGDSASVQAVTRVNAEQSSKRTMRRPTRQPFRGRLIRLGEAERRVRPAAAPG